MDSLVLRYDPARTARRNSFYVRAVGTLWFITAHLAINEATPPIAVSFYGQLLEPRTQRKRDPETNAPCLWISRQTEDAFTVEGAVLQHSLPLLRLMLIGWSPV